jgi:hypothetical protein
MILKEAEIQQSIYEWLTTRDAQIIISEFAKRRNLTSESRDEIVKMYFTTMLIKDAAILRSLDPTDKERMQEMTPLIPLYTAGYTKALEYFKTKGWSIPESGYINDNLK